MGGRIEHHRFAPHTKPLNRTLSLPVRLRQSSAATARIVSDDRYRNFTMAPIIDKDGLERLARIQQTKDNPQSAARLDPSQRRSFLLSCTTRKPSFPSYQQMDGRKRTLRPS